MIDAGFARVASYDADRGLDRLDLQRISKASATQRAGRAGRTAPGTCLRLWSEKQQHTLADFDLPEIRRVDLCGTVLSLHAWGKPDVRAFGWYDPPSDATLLAAERLLAMLGALDRETDGRLTPLGKQLVGIPAHPRVARLLLAAANAGLPREGASLAALISERDIVPLTPGRRDTTVIADSDLLHRLSLLDDAERQRFAPSLFDRGIDPVAARAVARVRDDLLRLLDRRPAAAHHSADDDALLRLPLHAYPDRVCKRRSSDPAAGAMVGGGGVRLASESAVRHGELFLAVDLRHNTRPDTRSHSREAIVRVASTVHADWLAELFPQSIRTEDALEFDTDRQRVVGFRRRWYLDLLLDEQPHGTLDADRAAAVLAAALHPRAAELFQSDPAAAELLARLALLRKFTPEHPWPLFDPPAFPALLAEAARGKRSLEELRPALADTIRTQLPYPLDRLLDQLAPTTWTVPTGNRLALQYSPDAQPPILAVRLQELFGLPTTPRIAAGRAPLKLHLLGPNYRPVQITGDLAHFWATTYFQVRKDLRARYPKHAWPDDPLTAPPQAKGRPTANRP